MVCSADWSAMDELDPRLIRMLARHFNDLQGRRMIAIALFSQITAMTAALLVALAGTVDSALVASGSSRLLVLAIGVASLWLAVAKFRERRYFVLWTLAAGLTLYAISGLSPARTFTVLLFSMSSAFTLTALVRSRQVFTLHRSNHADAI